MRFAAVVAYGTMAGFFFAYSSTVMPGLTAAEPRAALMAMQAINASVQNSAFGLGFWGTLALAIVTATVAAKTRAAGCGSAVAAAAVYGMGVFMVTAICSVPLNRALAVVDPDAVNVRLIITAYLHDWSAFNHARTTAGIIALSFAIHAFSKFTAIDPKTL